MRLRILISESKNQTLERPVPVENSVLLTVKRLAVSRYRWNSTYSARMIKLLINLLGLLFRSRSSLAAENLALRHQLFVLQRSTKRPRLKAHDRIFWVWLSKLWTDWRSCLVIVKPDTVVKWHRQGFKLYWRWKSKSKNLERPKIDLEIRELVRQMSCDNPTWGVPRIRDELALLGINVANSTIRKYRIRASRPDPQTWKTFIDNHINDIAAIDFFTVPTVTFRILYCFVILRLGRRLVVHFNITTNPTANWIAQQLTEAFPFEEAPRFIIRDRDGIYGHVVRNRIASLGIKEILTAPRSPWQNGYAERLFGSIRRECLDHIIVISESHLNRVLSEYFEYYHSDRPHQSLEGNAPMHRAVEPPEQGKIVAKPVLGGLHHRYRRAA